ncbi:hypothetical protein GLYMA_18G072250v4 [Glycine max]|nr:hypothetical protein GLYMA_18G072250v4 [Glycine max]KAH1153614.1 hypothetical protein GYH30_049311 [Glycine max]
MLTWLMRCVLKWLLEAQICGCYNNTGPHILCCKFFNIFMIKYHQLFIVQS